MHFEVSENQLDQSKIKLWKILDVESSYSNCIYHQGRRNWGARGGMVAPQILAALEAKPFPSKVNPFLFAPLTFAPSHGTALRYFVTQCLRKLSSKKAKLLQWPFGSLGSKTFSFKRQPISLRPLDFRTFPRHFETQCLRKLSSKKAKLLQWPPVDDVKTGFYTTWFVICIVL